MKHDLEYHEEVLTKVERESNGYAITGESGTLFIPDPGFEPRIGQTVRCYGRGFGFPVRGVAIDGRVVFYRTAAEEEARHQQWVADKKREKREVFERNRAQMDAEYEALPDVFKRRIDRFRAGKADWRPEFEAYEMCCCRDAVKIAAAMRQPETTAKLRAHGIKSKDHGADWPDTPEGRFLAFTAINSDVNGYRYQIQDEIVDGLDKGHSGNTLGFACRLAWWYLTKPELVALEHGALTPLVGCEDYGCTHEAVPA